MSGGTASRLLLVKKAGTTLVGVNAKTITAGSESIDVTTDDDNGYRCLLDVSGTETLDISGSGVTKDLTLRQLFMTGASKLLTDITIEYPPIPDVQSSGDTISGDFFFGGFTENGSGSGDAITFDFTMQSSGEWTFTPGTLV